MGGMPAIPNLPVLFLPLCCTLLVTACAPEPAASPRAAERSVALRDGPTLHYLEQGMADGEPVLLLHGYTDSSFSFSRILPLLPARLRVLALDQRGHGSSSKDRSSHTIADLAADVVAFLDALAIDRATVVGHCLGSMVAQRVAIDHPGRVRRLLLVSTMMRGGNAVTGPLLAEVRRLADPVDPAFVRDFQRSTVHGPVPEDFFGRACAESARLPARIWRQALEDFVLQDTTSALGSIRAPTRILWGDKDAIFLRQEQEELARHVPGATLRILADVGHAPHWEQPELFAQELIAFLGSTDAAR
jgi:non-heme chloroperoxidase